MMRVQCELVAAMLARVARAALRTRPPLHALPRQGQKAMQLREQQRADVELGDETRRS